MRKNDTCAKDFRSAGAGPVHLSWGCLAQAHKLQDLIISLIEQLQAAVLPAQAGTKWLCLCDEHAALFTPQTLNFRIFEMDTRAST
eukprot:1158063-Pelagomonas_calceolata.AAC.14